MVLKAPHSENFHEWRKRAKDLWYQVTLLRRLWPDKWTRWSVNWRRSANILAMIMIWLCCGRLSRKGVGEGNPRELEILKGLIDERQRDCVSRRWRLGRGFTSKSLRPSAIAWPDIASLASRKKSVVESVK
jgi:hypothetical protein